MSIRIPDLAVVIVLSSCWWVNPVWGQRDTMPDGAGFNQPVIGADGEAYDSPEAAAAASVQPAPRRSPSSDPTFYYIDPYYQHSHHPNSHHQRPHHQHQPGRERPGWDRPSEPVFRSGDSTATPGTITDKATAAGAITDKATAAGAITDNAVSGGAITGRAIRPNP